MPRVVGLSHRDEPFPTKSVESAAPIADCVSPSISSPTNQRTSSGWAVYCKPCLDAREREQQRLCDGKRLPPETQLRAAPTPSTSCSCRKAVGARSAPTMPRPRRPRPRDRSRSRDPLLPVQRRDRLLHDDEDRALSRAAAYISRDDELTAVVRERGLALRGLSGGGRLRARWLNRARCPCSPRISTPAPRSPSSCGR